MLNQKLVVDFDQLEGDLIFSTGNLYDRLIIEIDEILGLSETYDNNVKFSESGRNLHISIYNAIFTSWSFQKKKCKFNL